MNEIETTSDRVGDAINVIFALAVLVWFLV